MPFLISAENRQRVSCMCVRATSGHECANVDHQCHFILLGEHMHGEDGKTCLSDPLAIEGLRCESDHLDAIGCK